MLVLLPVARLLALNMSVLLLQTIFCLFAACRLVYLPLSYLSPNSCLSADILSVTFLS